MNPIKGYFTNNPVIMLPVFLGTCKGAKHEADRNTLNVMVPRASISSESDVC